MRCTSKSSNKTQYEYCTNELNADNRVIITNKYENQTITLYNALISKGRKCKLPEELKNILSNYILIKLEEDRRIDQYCMTNYNKHAFILQREIDNTQQIAVCDKYSILTDYSNEFDYVLVLKSESDQNYFLFINEGNNKPLVLSEHQEILNFFISHLKQTNDNNNLVRYIERVLKQNFSKYDNKPMKWILQQMKKDYELKYIVHDGFIHGVLVKNKIYLTPIFYWQFDESDVSNVDVFTMGNELRANHYDKPSIEEFDKQYVKELYRDYNTGKIQMVSFNGTPTFIQPMDLTSEWSINHDIVEFDFYANIYQMMYIGKDIILNNTNDAEIKSFEIGNIINIYIYMLITSTDMINKEMLTTDLLNRGVIIDGNTYTNYCDKGINKFISWRNSKINKAEYEDYVNRFVSFNVNDIIKYNYDMLQDEMKFSIANYEMISSKILTS